MDTINEFKYIISYCINSDGFGNVVALIELVILVITVLVGYFKMDEFRKEAICGFHINLFVFTQRLRFFFPESESEVIITHNIFSLMSANESIKQKYNYKPDKRNELCNLSMEILKYLSNAQKQVRPSNCTRKEWNKLIITFVEKLNRLTDIGDRAYADLNDETSVTQAYANFVKLLSNIENKLIKEQENFWEDLKIC